MEHLEPRQFWGLVIGLGAGNLLALLSYLSGLRISSLRRLPDLAAMSRAIPAPLQWHMVWALSASALLFVSDLNAFSWGVGNASHVATLIAAFAASLSGAARLYMGGSGRTHLLVVAAAALAFAAGLADLVLQLAKLIVS